MVTFILHSSQNSANKLNQYIIKELDYNTRRKQWTTKKQREIEMPTRLLCRKQWKVQQGSYNHQRTDYNTRRKQWTLKKQSELKMRRELLCRKLPKQRFKKKKTESLFQIFSDML